MGMWTEAKKLPGNWLGFGQHTAGIVDPTKISTPGLSETPGFGTNIGARNLGTRTVKRMNEALTGEGVFGKTMQTVMAFGAIALGAHLVGNYLQRRAEKKKQNAMLKDADAMNMHAAAIEMNAMADYIEKTGYVPEEVAAAYTRTDNVTRYAAGGQKAFADMAMKPQGPAYLN
jgi:hypothetical protein